MINRIENWIDQTNRDFIVQRKPCEVFSSEFEGFSLYLFYAKRTL